MLKIVLLGFMLMSLSAITTPTVAQTASSATCADRPAQAAGMRDRLTLEVDDMTRRYTLYVPTSYDPTQPTPIVLSIHGFASNPNQQATFSRWHERADADRVLVVYPEGTGTPRRWNAGGVFAEGGEVVDDVAYFVALLDQLEADFCIDTDHVYATGLSNGGGMSYVLACALPERITAVGLVAAALALPLDDCAAEQPVPTVLVHGVLDTIVGYEGSDDLRLPAIETWTADWAARADCDPTPSVNEFVPTVTETRYTDCAAPVVLYTISDGGHTWAGGLVLPEFIVGKTSNAIDATDVIWDFFTGL